MKRAAIFMLLVVGAMALPIAVFAEPIAILSYTSEPGDWTGQGRSARLVFRTSDEIGAYAWSLGAGPAVNSLTFSLFNWTKRMSATLQFDTIQLGTAIERGAYPNAVEPRLIPGHAGMRIELDGRYSRTLTGSFTISDIAFTRDRLNKPDIDRLRLTFEQHADGAVPALFGTFTFDESPVPEPGTLLLLGAGALGLCARCRSRVASGFFTKRRTVTGGHA